jgi:hypothetical protein
VISGSVILWRRQIAWQDVRIVRCHVARKQDVLWLLSQNGFVFDAPQRHNTIVPFFECAAVSISLPSASTNRTSPVTL